MRTLLLLAKGNTEQELRERWSTGAGSDARNCRRISGGRCHRTTLVVSCSIRPAVYRGCAQLLMSHGIGAAENWSRRCEEAPDLDFAIPQIHSVMCKMLHWVDKCQPGEGKACR